MKKNILSLFLLLAVVFSPVLAQNKALAQSATGQNAIPCTVLKVPPVLKMGSTGSEVIKLQIALKALGYLNIPQATGFYGFKTKAAVTQFQIDWNIVPFDGITGIKTATWIEKVTCAQASGANANLNNPNLTNNQQNNQQQNNQQQNNQQQNNQQQNNQQQNQQPGVTQNLTAPCVANVTAPFVEVDSPNGGEIYMNTDVLKVGWSTCNLAVPDTKMRVTLLHLNDVVMTADVLNTGSHNFILTPALIMNPPVPPTQPIAFDKLYKVQVTAVAANGMPTDMSDNTFSILDAGLNPNPNLNPNGGLPLGCIQSLTVFSPLNGQPCVKPLPGGGVVGPTTAADFCALIPNPHVILIEPNGGMKYQIGTQVNVLWVNCGVVGAEIAISLVQTVNGVTTRTPIVMATPNDNIENITIKALPGFPALVPGEYKLALDLVFTNVPSVPAWAAMGGDMSDDNITLVN